MVNDMVPANHFNQATIPVNHLLVDFFPTLRIVISPHGRVDFLEGNSCYINTTPDGHCKRVQGEPKLSSMDLHFKPASLITQ